VSLKRLSPLLCPMEEFPLRCSAGFGEMSAGKESRRRMMALANWRTVFF